MLKHFFVNAFRQLWRNKTHSLINIASLATGLTVFTFAFLYVKGEIGYDRNWPDVDRIHRLTFEQRGLPGLGDGVTNTLDARAYPGIKDYFSNEIDKISRLQRSGVSIKDSEADISWALFFVDEDFIDIFKLDVLEGSLDQVMQQPGFIALSETTAELLGEAGAIGNTIDLESGSQGGGQRYEIAAIYRLPDHKSDAADFSSITLINDYSLPVFGSGEAGTPRGWESNVWVWLKLKDGIDTDSFNAMQPQYIRDAVTTFDSVLGEDRKIENHLFYIWQKITDIHFNPVDRDQLGASAGDMARVITFGVIGVLVLLVGCSNSISLSLARVIERRREVGIRKAAGALPFDISLHSLGESVMISLLALVPAMAAVELLQPVFSTLFPFGFALETGLTDYLLLLFIAVSVGLVNGAYPALLLSRIRPQGVLKAGGTEGVKKGQQLRTILVAVQFCLASILLVGTAALFTQLEVTRRQPVGFSLDNVVWIPMIGEQQIANGRALLNQLESLPGVVRADILGRPPSIDSSLFNNITLLHDQDDPLGVRAHAESIGAGFFEITQIPLLAGRNFDAVRDAVDSSALVGNEGGNESGNEDQQPREIPIVINRSASRALGFDTPDEAVNSRIYERDILGQPYYVQVKNSYIRVIGVVEDNQIYSLTKRSGPEMYRLMPERTINSLLLRYEDSVEATILASIQNAFGQVNGNTPMTFRFLEGMVDRAFRQEHNESMLLLISASLALLLSFIGLYGLVSITMRTQVKEIGIRKVLGAKRMSIIKIFLTRFSIPVLLANVVAWPVAAYFVLQWIQRFPYQMEKAWLLPICLITSLLVLLIVWVTVGGLTLKAASSKPVTSLRYE